MKNVLLIGIGAAVLGGTACAQLPGITPISVRAGFSYLPNSDGRDLTGNGGFTVGAGIGIPIKLYGGNLSFDIDFDDHNGHSNTIQSLGFQGVLRVPMVLNVNTPLGNVGPYYGFGLGVFHNHVSAGNFSDTKTTIGGSALLGFQFTSIASAELFYRLSGSVNGVRTDTLGVSVAFHF